MVDMLVPRLPDLFLESFSGSRGLGCPYMVELDDVATIFTRKNCHP